jgi:predicted DNA-binding transcriptional regulator AlpA
MMGLQMAFRLTPMPQELMNGKGTMSRRRVAFDQRRVLNRAEVAAYLGKSVSWLTYHGEELLEAGFPQPLPIVGGYDKQAVDNWLDGLGETGASFNFDEAWTKAVNG